MKSSVEMSLPQRTAEHPDAVAVESVEITAGAAEPFIPAWIRDKIMPRTTSAEWKVLCVYISRADKRGESYPSLTNICSTAGLGVKSVKAARSGLVDKKLLREVRQERRNGKFGRKVFRLGWR